MYPIANGSSAFPKGLGDISYTTADFLVKLSQCAWKVLSVCLKQGVSLDDPIPGAVIAVQTFGDFLNFNPHLHIIATDGCFYGNGEFMVGPRPIPSDLEAAFRLEVFKMLKNLVCGV